MIGFSLFLLMMLFGFWIAYPLARLIIGTSASSWVRWCGTVAVAYWFPVALFSVLAPFYLFNLNVVLIVMCGLVLYGWIKIITNEHNRRVLRRDFRHIFELIEIVRKRPVAGLAVAAIIVMGARFFRAMVAPPLGWDALTYHLLRAGRWVQAGGYQPEKAPDAWGYYEYYPPAGDEIWAWAMLPAHSDMMLGMASLLVWLGCLIAIYGLCRVLDAKPLNAFRAALVLGLTPAISNYFSAAYVDISALTLYALGALFVIRVALGNPRECVLAIGALAVGAATKTTLLPIFVLGLIALIILLKIVKGTALIRRRLFYASCLAGAVLLPGYMRAWVETGSPLYPFELAIGDHVVLEGNEEMALLYSGKLLPESDLPNFQTQMNNLAVHLVWWMKQDEQGGKAIDWTGPFYGAEQQNLGIAAPFLILLALFRGIPDLLDRKRFFTLIFLLGTAMVPWWGLLSEGLTLQRTAYAISAGRFILPSFVAFAVMASMDESRWANGVWWFAGVVGILLSIPQGWSEVDLSAVGDLMIYMIPGLVLAISVGMFLWVKQRPGFATVFATLAVICALMMSVPRIRPEYRYAYYEAAVDQANPSFDVHRLHPGYVGAWPIWQKFDNGKYNHLAVAAGWDGTGHNWFRYPLLGSNLENRVSYVPVIHDGSIMDYREMMSVYSNAYFMQWLLGLMGNDNGEVDHFIALYPLQLVELQWIEDREYEMIFEVVETGQHGLNKAFRIRYDKINRENGFMF